MIPLSCSNCWYNGLQLGATLGLPVGYCAEHRVVLDRPYETTCGRLRRKDLPLLSVRGQHEIHRAEFPSDGVVELVSRRRLRQASSTSGRGLAILRKDRVGAHVADYGQLGAKIESLAQLNMVAGARPEAAMLSLGRGYVDRCVADQRQWTTGLHLFWWTRERLHAEPDVDVADLVDSPLSLERRVQLAQWTVVMLRLLFLSDIAHHAAQAGHRRGHQLAKLPQKAAAATGTFNVRRLLGFVRKEGMRVVADFLPERQYVKLSRALHDADGAAPASK